MSKAGNQSDRVLDLVRKTYDAALDEQLWSGMAAEIARTLDSTSTVLHLRDTQLGGARMLSVTENLTPAAMHAYRAHYWQHDLWVQRGAAHGLSKVVANKDLIADAELEETEFYQDWCRQIDAFYLVGTVFPVSGDEIGILGIHRPRDGRAYDETDKHAVGRFPPPICNARSRSGGGWRPATPNARPLRRRPSAPERQPWSSDRMATSSTRTTRRRPCCARAMPSEPSRGAWPRPGAPPPNA